MSDHVRHQAVFVNNCRAQARHGSCPESIVEVVQREDTYLRSCIKLESGSSEQGNQGKGLLLPPDRMQQEDRKGAVITSIPKHVPQCNKALHLQRVATHSPTLCDAKTSADTCPPPPDVAAKRCTQTHSGRAASQQGIAEATRSEGSFVPVCS